MKTFYRGDLIIHEKQMTDLASVEKAIDEIVACKVNEKIEKKMEEIPCYVQASKFTCFIISLPFLLVFFMLFFIMPGPKTFWMWAMAAITLIIMCRLFYSNELKILWYSSPFWKKFLSLREKAANEDFSDIFINFQGNSQISVNDVYKILYVASCGRVFLRKKKMVTFDNGLFLRFVAADGQIIKVPMNLVLLKEVKNNKKQGVLYDGDFLTVYLKKKNYEKIQKQLSKWDREEK